MRVISGTARGTRLRTLEVPHLRPMLDRVRQALFNIIRSEVEGAVALDLFSGCGALGIEALSRGAASCTFVERDSRLASLLRENIEKCGLSARAHILRADVLALPGRRLPDGTCAADLVFVDPPYVMVDDPNQRADLFRILQDLMDSWIARGALLVLHHGPLPYALWPTRRMRCFDRRLYGNSQISLFKVGEEGSDGSAQ
jgi:16S rRNA (guanine(966)-N(2))-methyltransferase RsmD